MRARKDVNTDLMTLPELQAERDAIMPKMEDNTATVRDARRFAMVHSLISMFENSKLACKQLRKNGNLGQQVKQDLIVARKRATALEFRNPVLRNGSDAFPISEDINDI